MLFASHAIVLVHHYLDRLAHSCLQRPPREYARGGGGGGKGGKGGKGGWGGGGRGRSGGGRGGGQWREGGGAGGPSKWQRTA